jgi:hypothetical protein
MSKKYAPLLKAINADRVADIMQPKSRPIPLMKTYGREKIMSEKQAEKRMKQLIEEVQFMSQYIRQGNKYAKVTAETNSKIATTKTTKQYV